MVLSDVEKPSLFALGNDMKSFLHAMGDDLDVYDIIEWEYDDEKALYEIMAITNGDSEFIILIDGLNSVITLYTEIEGIEYMMRYNIIEIEFEEEED